MNKKIRNILLALSVLSALGLLTQIRQLPEQIPVHWNIQGEIDGYGSRNTYLLLAVLPVFMVILAEALPKIDPKKENYAKQTKSYQISMTVLSVIFMALPWGILLMINRPQVNMTRLITLPIAALLFVLGYYMPTFKQTFFVGIRTPWTLADEVVWEKTHKQGRIVFWVMGIVLLITGLIQNELLLKILVAVLVGGIFYLYLYSYLVYKNRN